MRAIMKVAAVAAVAILVAAGGIAVYAHGLAEHRTIEVEHTIYSPSTWERCNTVIQVDDGKIYPSMLLTKVNDWEQPRWTLQVDIAYGQLTGYDVDSLEILFELEGGDSFMESMSPMGNVITSTDHNDPRETRAYSGWRDLDSAGVTWTFTGSDTRADPGTISGSGPTFRSASDGIVHVEVTTELVSQGLRKDTVTVHWTAEVHLDSWTMMPFQSLS